MKLENASPHDLAQLLRGCNNLWPHQTTKNVNGVGRTQNMTTTLI
jgi:hypothetical protein